MNPTLLTVDLDAPDMLQQAEQIQRIVEDEKARRKHFYETIEENQKVEFINGEVLFQSPAKLRHIEASDWLMRLLSTYADLHQLGKVTHEKLMITLNRNDYEPDISFFSAEKAVHFFPTQMQFPAPDFIVEVLSPSTEERDRGVKFKDYAAHGVQEYWLVDPELHQVERYVLAGREFRRAGVYGSDVIECAAVPGFKIRVVAIFDAKANLRELAKITEEAR